MTSGAGNTLPDRTRGRIGEDVGSNGISFCVFDVTRKSKLDGVYGVAASGHIFLIMRVSISNYRSTNYEYKLYSAHIEDSKGLSHLTQSSIMALIQLKVFDTRKYIEYLPESVTLEPRRRVSGYVPVEIPADSTGLVFVYNDPVDEVRIDIELDV
jgi:hypothetical protein